MGSLYERICAPLAKAGCELVEAPEAAPDELLDFAQRMGLPAACHIWAGQELLAPELIPVPLTGIDLGFSLVLAKHKGDDRRLVNRMWALAQQAFEHSCPA
jgi:hypothetical protein